MSAAVNQSTVHYKDVLMLILFNTIWMIAAAINKLYTFKTVSHIETIYRGTWRTFAAHIAVFTSIYYFAHNAVFSYKSIIVCYSTISALLVLNRLLLTYITEFIFKKVVTKRRVLIVGDDSQGKELADYFNRNQNLYSLAGIFNNRTEDSISGVYQESSAAYLDFATKHDVRDIYTTKLPHEDEGIQYLKDAAENKGMRVLFVAGRHQQVAATYHRIGSIDAMPVLSVWAEPLLKPRNIIRKRLFDIAFSMVVIVLVMSWLTPLIAMLIKLSSKGPVFFIQQRSGKDNQPFWCFKFRSMTVNESSDTLQATKGDSRITRIGAFMRKTSIDELPQFFNVLLGNMSIVGPRPHMLKHTEQYSAIINKYLVRHYLKPGITGWAQINGYRGETTDVRLMEKRVAYDIEYMENWSLMQDVKIVFMTIINVFRGEENAR